MHLTSVLLLSALGVSAHPSGHAHMHRAAHDKRAPKPDPAVGDLVTATINGKVVTWTNTYDGSPFVKDQKPKAEASPSPTPDTKAASVAAASVEPATPKASSGSSSSSGSGSNAGGSFSHTPVTAHTAFCGGATSKRATTAQIAYKGNTGVQGNYGCNMQLVASAEVAATYKYTASFSGAKTNQICACFNKIGSDGGINGFWETPVWFTLAPGATQYVAFDANSQGGCTCSPGTQISEIARTDIGQLAGAWLEHDFENTSNNLWSGADASIIVAQDHSKSHQGIKVCSSDGGPSCATCSTALDTGAVINAYDAPKKDADGIGLNCPPGKVHLDVSVEYSQ